jgi:RHS repeat-associated protein
VTKRFYAQGMQVASTNYYYTRDHLGSIRELTNSAGVVQARYDYDPYGRRTKLSGTLDADFGFTGHYYHQRSGLHLALFRAYDADLGRWISRDPIGEQGGINLYGYVGNNPVEIVDPLGLVWYNPFSWNWGKIGDAFTLRGGVGLGVAAKSKFGPLRCKLGADYTWTVNYNRENGLGESISGFAGGGIDLGGHELALKGEFESGYYDNGDNLQTVDTHDRTVGYKYNGAAGVDSNGKIGLDVTAGVLRGAVEISLPSVWKGITE